jgi:outer membrane immunogenic protein
MNKTFSFKNIICLLSPCLMISAAHAQWTGYYVGANGGYAWGQSDVEASTTFSETGYFAPDEVPLVNQAGVGRIATNGFTGGFQGGYNWQSDAWVYGLELDFGLFDTDATRQITELYDPAYGGAFTIDQTVQTEWLATVRPRVGYVVENLLIYATGGLAVTQLKNQNEFSDTYGENAHESAYASETQLGWTVGGGAEYLFADDWSIKAEYLYVDFGDISTTGTLTIDEPYTNTNSFNHTADLQSNIVRAGINYHF